MAKPDTTKTEEPDAAAEAKAGAEKETADKAEAKKPAKDPHEGLVKMTKGHETLHVHPTTVADHHKAGWKAD